MLAKIKSTDQFVRKTISDPKDGKQFASQEKKLRERGLFHWFPKQRTNPGVWYFKRYTAYNHRADIEATYGEFYRLIMNGNAAKTRAVKDNGLFWLASKSLESEPFLIEPISLGGEIYRSVLPVSSSRQEVIVRPYGGVFICTVGYARSLAAALVSSYVFEEYDLHGRNIRITPKGEVVRIDFEMSGWPITCQYRRKPISPDIIAFEYDYVAPKDAFPITKEDLLNFPLNKTSSAKPYHTVKVIFADDPDDLASKEFSKQKWKYFLKILLIEKELFKKASDQFLADGPDKKAILDHNFHRLTSLKEMLLSITEFGRCVLDNQEQFKSELMTEFAAYNATKKPLDPVRFDMTSLEIRWDMLMRKIRAKLVSRDVDIRKLFKVELLNYFESENKRLKFIELPHPDLAHPKVRQMHELYESLQAIMQVARRVSSTTEITVIRNIITRLEDLTKQHRGVFACLSAPISQKNWQSFKTQYQPWLEAFEINYCKRIKSAPITESTSLLPHS